MAMINTHYHYTIQGYEEEKDNTITGVVTIEVIADDDKKAILKAATLVDKKHFRVSYVRECHTNMDFIEI